MGERPGVVLIEDHKLLRDSQQRAIEADGRLRVLGAAGDGRSGLDLIRSSGPGVAAVDLRMKPINGWKVLEAVIDGGLGTKVVFVSAFDDAAVVHRALRQGASGFISKGTEGPDLCELLLRASQGYRAVSSDLQEGLLAQLGAEQQAGLSLRELEVLRYLAEGEKAEQIAHGLHLSTSTVRSHIGSILRKLEARNGTEAVARGFRRGLLE